jgi:ankyrin repeat protein
MRKFILVIVTVLNVISIEAQDKVDNIFLDREFWQTHPTVEHIKSKIAEGHDPTESDLSNFDGVSYGIIDDAPIEGLKYMLSIEGNPVTKPTHGDITYLLWAAYKGNIPLVEYLIDLKSDVQFTTTRGTNILLMSGLGGQEDRALYNLIFSQGVDIHSVNSSGTNILLALAGSDADDDQIFHYLAENGLDWNYKDNSKNGFFHYAARAGNLENMDLCLLQGIDYMSINDKGENALFYAAYGRKRSEVLLKTFTYLDSLGLEADIVNWEGQSPLHYAVTRGNPAVIDFFTERGVNIDQVDNEGNTAFMNSVLGNIENMQKLLPMVKNISQVNHKGHSALSNTILYAKKDAFDFLVENGADLAVLDQKKHDLISLSFQSYSESRKENFEYIIESLVAEGIKANTSNVEGNTLMHYAVEKNSPYLIQKAIDLNVDINIKNELGLSALHLAAMKATDNKIINMLLVAGADKNVLTDYEESTYHLANENEILMANEIDISQLQLEE